MLTSHPLRPALEQSEVGRTRSFDILDPVDGSQRAVGRFGFDKNRSQRAKNRRLVRRDLGGEQQKHQTALGLTRTAVEIAKPMQKFDTVPALLSHWPIA
jgi:hypothetical protein